jgi:hypothetical protein
MGDRIKHLAGWLRPETMAALGWHDEWFSSAQDAEASGCTLTVFRIPKDRLGGANTELTIQIEDLITEYANRRREERKAVHDPFPDGLLRQTSEKWCSELNVSLPQQFLNREAADVRIESPDGWDRWAFRTSFYEEKVTRGEFLTRLKASPHVFLTEAGKELIKEN